jgi:hypothetical protein
MFGLIDLQSPESDSRKRFERYTIQKDKQKFASFYMVNNLVCVTLEELFMY